MLSGDELYDDEITSGPYDHDAERNSQWCDRCGSHHSGPVGVFVCDADDDWPDDGLAPGDDDG